MVEVARQRGAELGVGNTEHWVMDAERIELGADSVDGVICRFGYMLMADPAAALAGTRRVLRPGRRLVLAVWAAAERNPWASLVGRVLVERGHVDAPEPGAPGMFSMAAQDRVRSLLSKAGFTGLRVEGVGVGFRFRDARHCLRLTAETAGPTAMAIRQLPDSEHAAVRVGLEEALEPFRDGEAYRVPGIALAAVAT